MRPIIYIEGGGTGGQYLPHIFRRAWTAFFQTAKLGKFMPRVVRGGTRNRTFDLFSKAIKNPDPNRIPLLLVDSEEAVQKGHSVWEHLQTHDGWSRPNDAGDDQAFLMVRVMETWFLTNRAALQKYFGAGFRENVFKQWPQLEDVSRATVLDTLKRATANCSKPYAKGKISFELLERIDSAHVETVCPHATVLLDQLRVLCR